MLYYLYHILPKEGDYMRKRSGRNKTPVSITVKLPAKKKPSFGDHLKEWGNFIFSLIASLTAIGSLLLTYSTLVEMRVERQNAYRPSIQFSSIEFVLQIGDQLDMEYITSNTGNENIPVFNLDDYYENELGYRPELMPDVYNIGVGTAKDIQISISTESCHNAINAFNEKTKYCDAIYSTGHHGDIINFYSEDDPDNPIVYFGSSLHSTFYFQETVEMPYLLPNASESNKYPLPIVYYGLIDALILDLKNAEYNPWGEGLPSIPDIEILISYSDVQGIIYQEKAYITTDVHTGVFGGELVTVSIIPENTKSAQVSEPEATEPLENEDEHATQ